MVEVGGDGWYVGEGRWCCEEEDELTGGFLVK